MILFQAEKNIMEEPNAELKIKQFIDIKIIIKS